MISSNLKNRSSFWFLTVAALCGFLILTALGTWQASRMVWKQHLLQQIEASRDLPPLTIADYLQNPEASQYRLVMLQGAWDHSQEIALQPRILEGQIGVHIVTLFVADNDMRFAVHRGWTNNRGEIARPNENVTLTARIMPPPRRNLFTPDNDAAAMNFYFYDADYFAAENENFQKDILLFAAHDTDQDTLIGAQERIDLPNNHRSYMIFWYFMACMLAVFYVLILRRMGREEG